MHWFFFPFVVAFSFFLTAISLLSPFLCPLPLPHHNVLKYLKQFFTQSFPLHLTLTSKHSACLAGHGSINTYWIQFASSVPMYLQYKEGLTAKQQKSPYIAGRHLDDSVMELPRVLGRHLLTDWWEEMCHEKKRI